MGSTGSATVTQIQVAAARQEPMTVLDKATFRAGHGIEGDRHAGQGGASADRQVLLMDSETQANLNIDPSVTRENVTTRGLDMTTLTPGRRIRLGGSAVVEVTGDCDPCSHMEAVRAGLRGRLEGRRGVLGKIVEDGTVHPGDAITVQ